MAAKKKKNKKKKSLAPSKAPKVMTPKFKPIQIKAVAPPRYECYKKWDEALKENHFDAALEVLEEIDQQGFEEDSLVGALKECIDMVQADEWLEALHWLELHKENSDSYLQESFAMYLGEHFETEGLLTYAINAFMMAETGQKKVSALFDEIEGTADELRTEFLQEAHDLYQAQAKRTPNDAETWLALGTFQVHMLSEQAFESFQRAVECDPTLVQADEAALMFFFLLEDGEQHALRWLEERCEQNPDEATLWRYLGKIYLHTDQQDKAHEAFDKAQKLDSTDVMGWLQWLDTTEPTEENLLHALKKMHKGTLQHPKPYKQKVNAFYTINIIEQSGAPFKNKDLNQLVQWTEELVNEAQWYTERLNKNPSNTRAYKSLLQVLEDMGEGQALLEIQLMHFHQLEEAAELHYSLDKLLQQANIHEAMLPWHVLKEHIEKKLVDAEAPEDVIMYIQDLIKIYDMASRAEDEEEVEGFPRSKEYGIWDPIINEIVRRGLTTDDDDLKEAYQQLLLMVFVGHLEFAPSHAQSIVQDKIPIEGEAPDPSDENDLSSYLDRQNRPVGSTTSDSGIGKTFMQIGIVALILIAITVALMQLR